LLQPPRPISAQLFPPRFRAHAERVGKHPVCAKACPTRTGRPWAPASWRRVPPDTLVSSCSPLSSRWQFTAEPHA